MAVATITDIEFEDQVVGSEIPVLVDFYADWCGPCKMAEPVLEELSEDYEGKVSFVKINIDESQEHAQKYSIMSIPTTILFKNGEEVGRQTGFSGREGFEELIQKAF